MRHPYRWLTFLIFPVLLAALFFAAKPAQAQENSVVIYFFWGDGCPHCAEEEPFLKDLEARYPNVEVRAYEVWYDADNQALLGKMADAYGFEVKGVPVTFVGAQHWTGYSASTGEQIEAAVQACSASGCDDAGVGVIPGVEGPQAAATPASAATPTAEDEVIDLPFIGPVDLHGESVFVSTLLISFVDGFNPCSLWVLSVLLALVLHTGSRKKIFLIGLIFITVTAGVYALFIAGLFGLLSYISFLGWIQSVVALVALFFAAVNIKDYFWYKEGLSFTIADEQKPGIYKSIRRVLDAGNSIWALAGATVLLAGGVSLVEFSCTAGFPVVWTNILTAQKVDGVNFALLLALYLVIYQLDELIIFLIAVFTMRASRLEEKHGRLLKLFGGTLMFTLSIVMLAKPSLMNSLGATLVIFLAAFALTLIIIGLHRKVLPSMGIYIGSELDPKQKSKHRGRK